MDLREAGEVFGIFQLALRIGRGPFGEVWCATERGSGRSVAAKFLRPEYAKHSGARGAFERLAKAYRVYKRLDLPGLPRILDLIEDPARLAYGIVSEHAAGADLSRVQIPEGVSSGSDSRALAATLGWFVELGGLLSKLHERNIVHGNLKPGNVVILDEALRGSPVCLLDLAWSSVGVSLPKAGPSFLSPEQAAGAKATAAADQFALAALLRHTLSRGEGALKLGALPAFLVMAIDRASARDPAARFESTAELVRRIDAVVHELRNSQDLTTPIARPFDSAPVPKGFHEEPVTERQARPSPAPPSSLPAAQLVGVATVRDEPSQSSPPSRASTLGALDAPSQPPTLGTLGADLILPGEFAAGDPLEVSMRIEPALGLDGHLGSEGSLEPMRLDALGDAGDSVRPAPVSRPPGRSLMLVGSGLMLVALVIVAGGVFLAGGSGDDLKVSSVTPSPDPAMTPPIFEADAGAPSQAASEVIAVDAGAVAAATGAETMAVAAPAGASSDAGVHAKPAAEPAVEPAEDLASRPQVAKASSAPSTAEKARTKESGRGGNLDRLADEAMARLAKLDEPASAADEPDSPATDCDEGDGKACLKLAADQERSGDKGVARDTYARACNFGQAEGCLRAGSLYAGQDDALAFSFFERSCKQKGAEGCHLAAEALAAGRGTGADVARAREYRAKACELGRKASCTVRSVDEKIDSAETSSSS